MVTNFSNFIKAKDIGGKPFGMTILMYFTQGLIYLINLDLKGQKEVY